MRTFILKEENKRDSTGGIQDFLVPVASLLEGCDSLLFCLVYLENFREVHDIKHFPHIPVDATES